MRFNSLFDIPSGFNDAIFRDLARMHHRMDRLMGALAGQPQWIQAARGNPPCDLSETDTHFIARFQIPGIEKEAVDLKVTGNTLMVSGHRPKDEAPDGARYHRRERGDGKFQRVIKLPGEVAAAETEAGLQNGILTVALSKAKPAEQQQIRIS